MYRLKVSICIMFMLSLLQACATQTTDLAKTLRYPDNKPVGLNNIQFKKLKDMRSGESCSYTFLHLFPLYGDNTIGTAAKYGQVNRVIVIGEVNTWYFPIVKNCTVVFGE